MKNLGCNYCEGAGPQPGLLWTDNNGPIVDCPICNDNSPSTERQQPEQPTCKRCNGTGWLEPIDGWRDGSYITSRPCPCGGSVTSQKRHEEQK